MPLQHVATPVLDAMRRGIDEEGTRELVSRIKEKVPGCALRTTMLVGFPGETDADFERLLDFVEETRFARLGGFVFSPEDRSIAARLPDQVPAELARERMGAPYWRFRSASWPKTTRRSSARRRRCSSRA